MTQRQAAWSGFGWGCVAGAALVGLMYYSVFLGLRPLPALLNEPLLSLMPGFVFGFLIDTLQHAGKVVEEAGLIIAMVLGLGVLGAAAAVASLRWTTPYLPFAFAAIGWLVVCAVLLPLGGAGFLGLNDGLPTPLIWAALFAIYAVILQYGDQPANVNVDLGRRRLLSTLPLSIAAVSVGALALRLTPNWYAAIFLPPGSGRRGVSPAVTPVENFYVVSKNFVDPQVDGGSWRLKVAGMVEKSLSLSLDDLRGLPASEQYTTMACISNLVGGDQISTGKFKGVPLRDLIASAGPQAQASWVGFKARDGYTESLPLSVVQGSPEILVVYELNDGPLPRSHGFPARVLIPGRYGMKAPKWLDEIDLVGGEVKGYWEQQGWDHDAVVRTMSRIDTPEDGDIVPIGTIEVAGVAFAGTRGVSKVEYSTDGGSHWSVAQFDAPLSRLTWVIWRTTWTPGSHGAYTLKVRTTDGAGALQDSAESPSFPSGSKGYHTVHVNVTG